MRGSFGHAIMGSNIHRPNSYVIIDVAIPPRSRERGWPMGNHSLVSFRSIDMTDFGEIIFMSLIFALMK
jgi:hypothetical protein